MYGRKVCAVLDVFLTRFLSRLFSALFSLTFLICLIQINYKNKQQGIFHHGQACSFEGVRLGVFHPFLFPETYVVPDTWYHASWIMLIFLQIQKSSVCLLPCLAAVMGRLVFWFLFSVSGFFVGLL